MKTASLTGVERRFREDEIIVSKTDAKGRITYCNDVFLKVAGYSENELMGKPHSIVRHPDMPRCVFKLLWDTVEAGKEIFAYVINRAKNGDHYWVFAHVTPDFDQSGAIIGFHSFRRTAEPKALATIKPIYEALAAEEAQHANGKKAMEASTDMLLSMLHNKSVSYDKFVLDL